MKKNDIIRLRIDSLTSEGAGVGRYEGIVVFVPFAAPGDEAICQVIKVLKSYCYAKILNIIDSSSERIEPDCQSFTKCGGCEFRHINYQCELTFKERIVRDAFKRIGGSDVFCEKILTTGIINGYRNKAQLPVSCGKDAVIAGFYSPRSHRVVSAENCHLHPQIFNQIVSYITHYQQSHGLSCYDEQTGVGLLRHIYLRRGYHSQETAVCLVVTQNTDKYGELTRNLTEVFPEIKTILLNINPEKTNVILGEENVVLFGDGTISDEICGLKVKLSPQSFYQVNTAAAELLYKKAAEYAALLGSEVVLDLYCGAGTIGLSLAKYAKRVIGVEIVGKAVENACENALANGIKNAEFYEGDAGDIARRLEESGTRPDVIILDPPRKGCSEKTLDAVINMSPRRIVMISCNPATAARDTKYLCERGYTAEKICPVDMFPRTRHVECIVLMSRIQE